MAYFNFLRTFVTVYRCGSYNKASEILGTSQPAISRHINSLEQQLDKKLFKKNNSKGLEPTDAAHALAKQISPHVDQLEKAFSSSRASNKELRGTIYIGAIVEVVEYFFCAFVKELRKQDISFVFKHINSMDGVDQLKTQNVDFCLTFNPAASETIDCHELAADRLVTVVSADLYEREPLVSQDTPPWNYIAHSFVQQCVGYRQFYASMNFDEADFCQAPKLWSRIFVGSCG